MFLGIYHCWYLVVVGHIGKENIIVRASPMVLPPLESLALLN